MAKGDLWTEAIKSLGGGNEVECGPIRFLPNYLKNVGDRIPGHTHNFPHATFFMEGEFLLRARFNGVLFAEEDIVSPAVRLILPQYEHEIIAKVQNCFFVCIYSHRDPQGNVVERCEGYMEAYR